METRAYLKLFSVTISITIDQAKQLIKDQYEEKAPQMIVAKLYEHDPVPIGIPNKMSKLVSMPIGEVWLARAEDTTGKDQKTLPERKPVGRAE